MMEYDIFTITDELLMRDSLERICRSFAIKLSADQVTALAEPNCVVITQGNLWQARDRKQGYPLEDPITLKIKPFVPNKVPPNINPKILDSWWGSR